MNVNPDSPPTLDADLPAGDAAEAPAKPVRRKRAVVAKDESGAAPEVAAAGEEAAPKPVRRRRAAATADATDAGEATAVATHAAVDTVAEPAPQVVLPTAPVRVEELAATASPAFEAAGDGDAPAAESAADAPQDSAVQAEGADGPRSERSRRRSRRDRKRGERGEAGDSESASAGLVAQDGTPTAPPPEAGAVFAQVLSGDFDVTAEAPPEAAEGSEGSEGEEAGAEHKRVLQPDADAPKLQKVLAQAGVGSRRDMEELILEGLITVNDQPAHIGQRISFGDRVMVRGKPVRYRIVPPPPRIIAYHKPVGEVVTHDDPQNRPTVFRRLPRLQHGKWQSVGRLDINTEGLLLFTTSGELANQLMHPRFGVEREYAVRVLGTLSPEDKAVLLEGVSIDGQTASFRSIEDGGGEGANHWYRVVITEGRNREVRKLFDAVELTVSRLIRIRYGTVVLPLGLKRGVWVDLGENDVRAIRRLAAPQHGGPQQGGQQGAPREGGQQGQRDNRQAGRNNERGGPPQHQQQPRQDRQAPRPNDRGRAKPPFPRADEQPDRVPPPQQQQRAQEFEGDGDNDIEFDPSQIPNPLEQTFDKRFVQNPRSPAGGRGFNRGGGGFGSGGSAPAPAAPKKGSGPREPDPLQTSIGYLGADAFHRKGNKGKGGGGNRGGGFGGGGGGGNFGGGGGGGGRRGR